MKKLAISVLFFIFAATAAMAGKPGSCSDVPISITFVAPAGVPAAIWNDDPTKAYSGGSNTEIHNCNGGDNGGGSYDGTMTLPGGRSINMKFPAAISGSIIEGGPASFAAGNSISTGSFVKIHNLTGQNAVPAGISATYYTRALFTFDGPDRKSYRLEYYPDDSTCPSDHPCAPELHGCCFLPIGNQPVQTSWVKVIYTARNRSLPWSTSNTDSWVVQGDLVMSWDTSVARSVLFNVLKDGTFVHYGQYSMPFKMVVTALAAMP